MVRAMESFSVPPFQLEAGGPMLVIRNTFVDCHEDHVTPPELVRSGSCPAELSCLKSGPRQRPGEENSIGTAETASSEGGESGLLNRARKEMVTPEKWVDSSSSEDEDDELVGALTRAATHSALSNSPWRALGRRAHEAILGASSEQGSPESRGAASSGPRLKHGYKSKKLQAPATADDLNSDSSSSSSSSSGSSSDPSEIGHVPEYPHLEDEDIVAINAMRNYTVLDSECALSMPVLMLPENALAGTQAAQNDHGKQSGAVEVPQAQDGEKENDEEQENDDAEDDVLHSPQPQMLRCKRSPHGVYRVTWVLDARKLKGNDKQAVSPAFALRLGHGDRKREATFKMMIYPKSSGDATQGAGCFKKARGHGAIQLKCEAAIAEEFAQVTYQMSIGNRSKMQPQRAGAHNFAHSAVCGLPKGKDLWNFNSAVDTSTMLFFVILEIATQIPQ